MKPGEIMRYLSALIIGSTWVGVAGMEALSYWRHGALDPTLMPLVALFVGGALHQLGIQVGLPLVNGELAKRAMLRQIGEAPPAPRMDEHAP